MNAFKRLLTLVVLLASASLPLWAETPPPTMENFPQAKFDKDDAINGITRENDDIGDLFKKVILDEQTAVDFETLFASEAKARGVPETQVRNELASRIYGLDADDVGVRAVAGLPRAQPTLFKDVLTICRSRMGLNGMNAQAMQNVWNSAYKALKLGADKQTVKNLLWAIATRENPTTCARAVQLLNDMGEVAKKVEAIAVNSTAAKATFKSWLIQSGHLPLNKANANWFGLIGETKMGKVLVGVKDLTLESWNSLNGTKKGADAVVHYGSSIAVEMKNIDIKAWSKNTPVAAIAQRYAAQLKRHVKQVGRVAEKGKGVVLLVMCEADQPFVDEIMKKMKKLKLTKFTKDQIAFLGVRTGDKTKALEQVLELGKTTEASTRITTALETALKAAK